VFTAETFADLSLNGKLKEILAEKGFTTLTGVQKHGIPALIQNQRVILKSETGSGKTLAYLVPLLEQLSKYSLETEKISRDKGTYCIIFSPTRELCIQIENELSKLLKLFYYVVCGTIMGGENPKKEKEKLRKGLTVCVCTPGRLLYHLQNTQNINFSRLQTIIIDEADRLLDMGFEKEMTDCLENIKKRVPAKFTQKDF
jgi:ATP-dependent RNA helicase DDX31/DBP7